MNIRLYPEGISSPLFTGTFWIHGRTNIAGISRFEEVAWCPGLYWFHTCALCHEVSHRELFANILFLPFVLLTVFFQSSLKTHMTKGEDRNKDRFKNWQLCDLWELPFRHHGAIKPTQTCVSFTNPCINPFVPTSVTLNTTPRCLNVSTCYSVFLLTCRIHCLGCLERHNTSIFLVLNFVPAWSHAAENRSNACWRPCWEDLRMQYQFVRKKQMVHLAIPTSDTLVDAFVTVYPIHIDQGSPNFWKRTT